MNMEVCHKLTDEENIELYNIAKLLKSADEESVELGIGLLGNYPESARTTYFVSRYVCISEKYTPRLNYIISKHRSSRESKLIISEFAFLYNGSLAAIDFVINVLMNQCYYYEQ